MDSKIITADNNYQSLDEWIKDKKKILLVCGDSIKYLKEFNRKMEYIAKPIIKFSDFQSNPLYESVVKGVKLFRKEKCDSIISVGGGSAIDVAKCIKLYANQSGDGMDGAWLNAKCSINNIPFLVMPTTAGTGSEATRYAVIYYKGMKQSITNSALIPDTVLMDPKSLRTLPLYQRKATMCDALSHAIESFWSINSNDISREYSKIAIQSVLNHMDGYLNNTEDGNAGMLQAAHVAGKAINISQTTAGHAMSYMLTSLYGFSHGHAVALCLCELWRWMMNHTDMCMDIRGASYLEKSFIDISAAMNKSSPIEAVDYFEDLIRRLSFTYPNISQDEYPILVNSVNIERLNNNPIKLDQDVLNYLYHEIGRKCK